jgi:hypothetical protein
MDVDDGTVRLGGFPERPQPAVAQFHVARGRRNADAGEAKLGHAAGQLSDREVGGVERHAAEADQAARIGGDHFRHAVVQHPLQPQAFLRLRPMGALLHEARGQHLDVDAHGVHAADAFRRVRHALLDEGIAFAHDLSGGLAHVRVGVRLHEPQATSIRSRSPPPAE